MSKNRRSTSKYKNFLVDEKFEFWKVAENFLLPISARKILNANAAAKLMTPLLVQRKRLCIIKIQSRSLIQDNRLFAMIPKKKILDRIIQSKIIPVQVQIFLAWTWIGIVCKNIWPLNLLNPSILTYESADIKLAYFQSAFSSSKVDGSLEIQI